MLFLICLGISGCYQGGEGQADEQKNPYFIAGKERLGGRDYKGAIDAFEKALETNPRSVLAHYELGMLYENHSDQKEEDFVAAMYHYNQVMKLRPNDYPADNARERVAYCKREVVKTEALAPVAPNLMRDLEKLRGENASLRKQLETCQTNTRVSSPPRGSTNRNESVAHLSSSFRRGSNETNLLARSSTPSFTRDGITPLPPLAPAARTHTVKERETFFSIARQYHLKPEALTSANPTVDPKRLKVGQAINVPGN